MSEAMVHATRKAAQASGGRPVPASNLHVTLAFLGSVPERRVAELAEIARSAAAGGSLELAFDHLEYWRAVHLLCALPAESPPPVVAFAQGLQEGLVARGFVPDAERRSSPGTKATRRFRPHVTLARGVSPVNGAMAIGPVTWSFADFVLVDSRMLPEGSCYTVLERFPLGHSSRMPQPAGSSPC